MSIFQVSWKQLFHSQEVRNIFYYQTTVGDPSSSEWVDIADEIRIDLLANWVPSAVAQWAFYGIDYRKVDVAGLLSFEALPTLGILLGAALGDSTATQIAILLAIKGLTTKPNRARSYLCGLDEANIINSQFISPLQAAAELLIDLQSALNGAGANPLTRVAAQWNTAHTMVTAFNDISGQPSRSSITPATQRRRRIGVGI